MTFNPSGNELVNLVGYTFRVRALGSAGNLANRAMRIVGGRAQVYQLIETETEQLYALKVMLPAFRKPQLVRNRDLLAQLAPLPGFEACRQIYLTPETHREELERYPNLAYASLMPWIPGANWTTMISNPDVTIDDDCSWEIAYQFLRLVRLINRHNLAHCDLSGGNVMVDLDTRKVSLIDFDEVYWPGGPVPAVLPSGTPGYRKHTKSQWEPAGDRFATAILVAEMLGWRDEHVRSTSSGDSFFSDEDCLNRAPEKFKLMEDFLHQLNGELGYLFERAWRAPSNQECPTVDEWRTVLMVARGWHTVPLDPLDRARIDVNALPREVDATKFTEDVTPDHPPSPQPSQPPQPEQPGRPSGEVVDSQPGKPAPQAGPPDSARKAGPPKPRGRSPRVAAASKSSGPRDRSLMNTFAIGVVTLSVVALLVSMFLLLLNSGR